MRAAVTRGSSIQVEVLEDPVPGPGQLLVRPLACGICGSDVHALEDPNFMERSEGDASEMYAGGGVVFGHEFSAQVIAHGPETTDRYAVGDAVCSMPAMYHPTPNGSRQLERIGWSARYPGALSELMLVSESLTFPIPKNLDHLVAALTEPFAVAARAVNRSGVPSDSPALVLGCGPVGLAVVATLKSRGATHVIACDYSGSRRQLAQNLGADEVLDPQEQELTLDRLTVEPKVFYECTGAPGALGQIINAAPRHSPIVVLGAFSSPDTIVPIVALRKELTIIFSRAYNRREFPQALDTLSSLVDEGIDVASMITNVVSLSDAENAIHSLSKNKEQGKVMIDPAKR